MKTYKDAIEAGHKRIELRRKVIDLLHSNNMFAVKLGLTEYYQKDIDMWMKELK